jgi:polygalacturonase
MRAGVAVIALLAAVTAAESAVIHVRPTGSDGNTGLDWSHAKATVGAAIQTAAVGDEVWVAAGTYTERIRNRLSGELSVDIALYGGFAGTETSRDARNIAANATILGGGGAESRDRLRRRVRIARRPQGEWELRGRLVRMERRGRSFVVRHVPESSSG